MEDNLKKYLDKVVEFLVRDTGINYENNELNFPFFIFLRNFSVFSGYLSSSMPLSHFRLDRAFSKYCKDVYGLTDKEIEYVWDRYFYILIDKIKVGGVY